MAKLIPISTGIAGAAPDSSAKKGRKHEQRESVSAIMLTPFLALILVFLFSAVGSVLAGS